MLHTENGCCNTLTASFDIVSAGSGWEVVTSYLDFELVRRGIFPDLDKFGFLLTNRKDYYATIYAAEIINTLTNLLFMYLAAKGIHNCIRNGHDTVFLVAFIGYLLVGTGSFLFHATLKCTHTPPRLGYKVRKASPKGFRRLLFRA